MFVFSACWRWEDLSAAEVCVSVSVSLPDVNEHRVWLFEWETPDEISERPPPPSPPLPHPSQHKGADSWSRGSCGGWTAHRDAAAGTNWDQGFTSVNASVWASDINRRRGWCYQTVSMTVWSHVVPVKDGQKHWLGRNKSWFLAVVMWQRCEGPTCRRRRDSLCPPRVDGAEESTRGKRN